MPAKKASKPKRKSSSSTLTKYSRSRPLGPELKWFDVNTPNSIVGFGLATLIQAQHCPFSGTGPNQRIGRTIVVKEIEIKINMQAAWAYVGATVPSAAGISYRRSHSGQQANGAVPLGADIYDTLVAGVSPENRFMNLLNSDRFSLVKRWEGDINPPSFIVPDATGSTLIVGRDLRLKKKCSIRVELTPNAAPTILDVKSNNLLLVFFIQSKRWWCTGVEVVNTFGHSHPFPGCVYCDILDYYRK